MRQAEIYYNNNKAGILIETNDGIYTFQYYDEYILEHPNDFITFSMPVKETVYKDKRLFAFFEGLIPEGWLLNIATKSWNN